MLTSYKMRTPIYKAILIEGVRTENGYKLLSKEAVDEFAKHIQMDWYWDSKYGEVKFDVPGSHGLGIPIYSVMTGYYVVSDGTPKVLRIYDEAAFKKMFEELS